MNKEQWAHTVEDWIGPDSIPGNSSLGALYPWREVMLHGMSRRMIYAERKALAVIKECRATGIEWRVGLSAGKDSTALALVLAKSGWTPRATSVKDDIDYPGELRYIKRITDLLGFGVDVLSPPISLLTFLEEHGVSLVEDLHSQSSTLSSQWFYGLLNQHREEQGYDGVILGLRSRESRGRAMNRAIRGTLYTRAYDGLTVASPIADWTALDVHAYVLKHSVPLLPLYFCLDPGMDWTRVRKSWWIAGGPAARYGHYVWLKRWWPNLWSKAARVDPEIAVMS